MSSLSCCPRPSQGKRLLGMMGYETDGLTVNIGLEQEMFLVPVRAQATPTTA